MDDHLIMFSRNVTKSKTEITSIEDMLNSYPLLKGIDLEKGHDFEDSTRNGKIIPSLKFATEKDAEEITNIFREVYENTYPYKLMENVSEILSMIKSPNYYWIIFRLKPDIIAGCIGIRLDFENKIGNFFGFAFRKKFQHIADISTASIACVVAPMYKFKNQIFIWFAEIRSSFSSIQYIAKLTGLSPVGLLPNKDIFFNKPESEILFIIYNQKILDDLWNSQKPQLISPAIFCYFHAFQKYNLGLPVIQNDNSLESEFNQNKIKLNRKIILRRIEKDKFGNELITISMKGTNNFFQFFHYPDIQIVEKVNYKVSTLEDLYVFLEEIKSIIREYKLRYFEVFLSAYDSTHQTLFYNAGFKPTGYIPAFRYNIDKNMYEDQVLFVYHEKKLNTNTQLIRETEEFLKTIKYFKEIGKK
ncbi:MAG: hypothetical protein KGD70_02390 [Candidatus Lokiarchaeota archaeon]|nr:hypothetical protein [Candidatus Lokiarchaeota archaeon]